MPESSKKVLTGSQAAEFLGVKPATLYAYVSRGLIKSTSGPTARERSYRLSDLIKLRQSVRGFKANKNEKDPSWTGPVIKSSITEIKEDGHRYRGRNAIDLVCQETPFEFVTELLWETGVEPRLWWDVAPFDVPVRNLEHHVDSLDLFKDMIISVEMSDPVRRALTAADVFDTARRLMVTMPYTIGLKPGGAIKKNSEFPMAHNLLAALTGRESHSKEHLINCALVLCADHELNASALAARIAASCDASLYSCLLSALATFSGTSHGSASRRAEDIVSSSMKFNSVTAWLKDYLLKFERVPGFGTELYGKGDPRARLLLDMAESTSGRNKKLRRLIEIVDCVRTQLGLEPNIDVGLAAMSYALSLPPGSGTTIFAVSRTAGWIAHAIEQRKYGGAIRPRARYIGKS